MKICCRSCFPWLPARGKRRHRTQNAFANAPPWLETIRAYARSDASVLGTQGLSERVLEAMAQTKRHLFIHERSCSIAYADRPIPIGLGQTISQPFIVALMTQLAAVAPDHVVLEIGTGSGYQAAILAQLTRKVCTIEIIPPLAEAAAKTLRMYARMTT